MHTSHYTLFCFDVALGFSKEVACAPCDTKVGGISHYSGAQDSHMYKQLSELSIALWGFFNVALMNDIIKLLFQAFPTSNF